MALVIVSVAAVTALAVLLQRSAQRRKTQDRPAAAEPTSAAAAVTSNGATPTPVAGGHNNHRARPNTIAVTHLTKRYGHQVAVDDLSFDVTPGKVTGFLGPNGAGKSTTMRLILGLDRPDQGAATINGRPYHDLEWPLRQVGALLEAKSTHPGRSAYSHLLMLAKANRIPRQRVPEVLEQVGLATVANRPARGFSLGMSQRLGIATALLGDPGIVILDEPVNGLDTDGIRWVRQLLRRLATEGRAVLVSSHLMSEVAHSADQLVVIGRGRLIADMATGEFTARYGATHVTVRSPQHEQLRQQLQTRGATVTTETDQALTVRGMDQDHIGHIAWQHSIMITELSPQTPTLEQAFIESTQTIAEYTTPAPGHHPTTRLEHRR